MKIQLKHKKTNEIVNFGCFNSKHKDIIIIYKNKLEPRFEHEYKKNYEPIGYDSWDKLEKELNEKSLS